MDNFYHSTASAHSLEMFHTDASRATVALIKTEIEGLKTSPCYRSGQSDDPNKNDSNQLPPDKKKFVET